MAAMLEVQSLSRAYGGIRAVDDVSFSVARGVLTGVIGPNGAGKTTLFNLISGTVRPTSGVVLLDGQPLAGLSAGAVARRGLVRTFQMTTVFANCSVWQNLYRAALFRQLPTPAALMNPFTLKARRERAAAAASSALETVGMQTLADADAGSLAYGQQKVLGVGMALAAAPRMLLMDEPAAGLNPVETEALGDLIARVHASGIDIILVEHDMQMVMRLCRRIVVLVNGRLLAEGDAAEIRDNPQVIEAYLGADLDNA